MIRFILTIASGFLLGLAAAWVPYGASAVTGYLLISAVYPLRLIISSKFRNSFEAGAHFNILLIFWLALAWYHFKPSGINTYLPVMKLDGVPVSRVVAEWNRLTPEIKFRVDEEAGQQKLTMNTIAKVTVKEALEYISEEAGIIYKVETDPRGASIAGGPRITVDIRKGIVTDGGKTIKKPFVYDGL